MTPGELLHAAWTWSPAFSALASSIAATMTVINLGVYRRASRRASSRPRTPLTRGRGRRPSTAR